MILTTIKGRLVGAMKRGDKDTTLTLRSLIAALYNERIKKGDELTDDETIKALKSELKKRDEAREAYESAGRKESAQNERREKEIILSLLPKQLSSDEIEKIVNEVLEGVADKKDFGALMKTVRERTKGKADGAIVAQLLKKKL